MAMRLVQTIEVGSSGAANIEFTEIPQTGKDLLIVTSARNTNSSNDNEFVTVQFNGSSTNYSWRRLVGTGSAVQSSTDTPAYLVGGRATNNGRTSNSFGNTSFYVHNYTSSLPKVTSTDSVEENNATAAFQDLYAGRWNDTAPITSIKLAPSGGYNFVQYTTARLYIIEGPEVGGLATPKATGGLISYTGTHWVHTFTSSGTFTPTQNLTNVEYVVVAGGGGGGSGSGTAGGGGGAGGYRSSVTGESSGGGASAESKLSLTSGTGYTVTVGGGGGAAFFVNATQGSASAFDSITTVGGGYGGGNYNTTNLIGGNGGSGGGGAQSGSSAGGTGTANQGYAAGNGSNSLKWGGAGGGASAEGASGTDYVGGFGLTTAITGSSRNLGGGGSSGRSESGVASPANGYGGGRGSVQGDGLSGGSGTANTGGGGGGGSGAAGNGNIGGSGGSGIVIVRYAA